MGARYWRRVWITKVHFGVMLLLKYVCLLWLKSTFQYKKKLKTRKYRIVLQTASADIEMKIKSSFVNLEGPMVQAN